MLRVKICGLLRQQDAELAADFGADALGFVHEPLSPRFIGEGDLKWIERLPPFSLKVAVFGRVTHHVPLGVFDLVQGAEWDIHPVPFPKRLHTLRLRKGQRSDDFVQQTINASAIVLDAHKDGQYGGTGHTVDWDLAAEIVQRSDRPVVLAGGLTPDNVADAIRRVRPYAVDVSSGIESGVGIKDPFKLRDFIQAAREA